MNKVLSAKGNIHIIKGKKSFLIKLYGYDEQNVWLNDSLALTKKEMILLKEELNDIKL